jgi:hypothetical protein
VERTEIEPGAEGLFGAGAELEDFELAHFVAEGLGGPGDVATLNSMLATGRSDRRRSTDELSRVLGLVSL